MIQRIQSLWLFLAALVNAGLFYFDLYRTDVMLNSVTEVMHYRINDHYPSLLIALVIIILPLVTIFMFRNRKRQRAMSAMCLVSTVAFISMMLMRIGKFQNTTTTTGYYWIGAVLPVISLIFVVMALIGINKDEKLVKSSDRLR
jgi:peptidoglycan/LPS O-acetylase OafA/YrhL